MRHRYDIGLVETYIFNPRWECDRAVADAYEDGPEAWIALEASGILEGALQDLCAQLYYGTGTGGNTAGFPGLLQAVNAAMVIDAGGTTDDVASSVWAVRWGPKDVAWVVGRDGKFDMEDPRIESLADADSNRYSAYVQEMLARPGAQVGSVYSVGRIKKLTTDNGKGLTDALIGSLLSKFPVGRRPDALYMSRRSLEQLRASRTATNATGAPAPIPTEAFGVPIQPTDAIFNTEKLAL